MSLSDKKQGVPFDRWLMRIKDIISIACNLLTLGTVIVSAIWAGFKFIESQNQQQQMINQILQAQIKK